MSTVKTTGNFIISESEFNDMFPNRNPTYTYNGLVTAATAFSSYLVGFTEETTLTNMLAFWLMYHMRLLVMVMQVVLLTKACIL